MVSLRRLFRECPILTLSRYFDRAWNVRFWANADVVSPELPEKTECDWIATMAKDHVSEQQWYLSASEQDQITLFLKSDCLDHLPMGNRAGKQIDLNSGDINSKGQADAQDAGYSCDSIDARWVCERPARSCSGRRVDRGRYRRAYRRSGWRHGWRCGCGRADWRRCWRDYRRRYEARLVLLLATPSSPLRPLLI